MIRSHFLRNTWFVSIIFCASLLPGCSKNSSAPDPGTNPPPASGKKLSKIEYDNGSYEWIEYNSNGTVSKITNHIEYSGNSVSTVYSLIYAGTVLSEIRSDDGSKYKYTYNNQQLTKTEYFSAGGNLVAYYEYTYKNAGLWRTDSYTRAPGGGVSTTPTVRKELEYYASGNIKKLILYFKGPSTGLLDKTDEFVMDQYDAGRNTSILFETNPYIPLENFNPNNPLSELHYNAAGNLEDTVTHTYTYDANGNPLTRKTVTKTPGMADYTQTARFYY